MTKNVSNDPIKTCPGFLESRIKIFKACGVFFRILSLANPTINILFHGPDTKVHFLESDTLDSL